MRDEGKDQLCNKDIYPVYKSVDIVVTLVKQRNQNEKR